MKRRKLLKAFGASVALPAGGIRASNLLSLTGSDAEGPFYPVDSIPLTPSLFLGNNALGNPLAFSGRALNPIRSAQAGLRIEIWQCDANSIYNHPADRGNSDPHFRGYAAQLTDENGQFSFKTIVPIPYAGRPPHIHVKIWREQTEILTTQIYLEGHRGSRDRRIHPTAVSGVDDTYEAHFDFVV